MCRRASALRWALAGAVALAAGANAGCHSCSDHKVALVAFDLAEFNYRGGKFDQAKSLYMRAIENCSDHYEALVGLGNACREYGTELYRNVSLLVEQGKPDPAQKMLKEANQNHAESDQYFRTALQRRPDDLLPHYGLGQLWYQRATTTWPFPYALDDRVNRRRDRDQAIREFTLVVQKVPQLYQAHRYLGLLLFAAGQTDEGRAHLKVFHDAQQKVYVHVMARPAETDEMKKQKDLDLRQIEKEIEDVREVLVVYKGELDRQRDLLHTKTGRTAEEEQKLAHVTRETLVLENVIKSFVLTKLGPVERELQQRCTEYLETFNQGALEQILAQVAPRPGEEELRNSIRRKVEQGTRYSKVRFTAIVVSGETASVGLVCELATKQGVKPETEMTFRWQRVGGRWFIADHP
jgi:tetratricopeptide (TPR) repeat protein